MRIHAQAMEAVCDRLPYLQFRILQQVPQTYKRALEPLAGPVTESESSY
jgi:hypothetical protein